MKKAMKDSFTSVSASALTTLFGFFALLFMNYKIGPDMGKSLVLGVILSFISVMVFLPAVMTLFYKQIDKTRHKSFFPDFKKAGGLLIKRRTIILVLVLLIAIPCYYAQGHNEFTYGQGEATKGSKLDKDTKKQESIFGKNNMLVILVPKGDANKEYELSTKLLKNKHIEKVVSYSTVVGKDVPVEFVPKETVAQFYSKSYSRIILYTDLSSEGTTTFKTIENIKNTITDYYKNNYYMCGQTASMYDMKNTIVGDNTVVNIITIISILLVLLIEFKSILIPLLLVISIKIAFWINMAIPFFLGNSIGYIGYIVVSAVMMGSTIDYAILITDKYLTNRKTLTKLDAMKKTLNDNIKSVLVSALVLMIAGFSLSFMSSEDTVKVIGGLIGKGALIALIVTITFYPALLLLTDKLLPYTTKGLEFVKRKSKNN
jgi:predicted RND superfamily exporter protein